MARNEALKEKKHTTRETTDRVPFTITDNPALPSIQGILRNKKKKKNILHSTERLRNIFNVVAFRRSPNFRDLLVRAKLTNTVKKSKLPAGTFRCNSSHGCLTCPYINQGRTSYTVTNTGEKRRINIP